MHSPALELYAFINNWDSKYSSQLIEPQNCEVIQEQNKSLQFTTIAIAKIVIA